MFKFTFWVLLVWTVVNGIWMWSVKDNAKYQKTFAWINVVGIIWGFWVYFGVTAVSGLAPWLMFVNIVMVLLAIYQFYLGYKVDAN